MKIYLLVTLICLIGCGSQLLVSAAELGSVAREVIETLEKFVHDDVNSATGLKPEHFEQLYEDLQDESIREEIEEELSGYEFQLIEDFILIPMKRWHPSKTDDEETKKAYYTKMEQAFKRFWPAFIDREPIGSKLMYDGTSMTDFVKSMTNQSTEKPTLDMWRKAKEEYQMIEERIVEIVYNEDVYEHLDELESNMNYFNANGYRHFILQYADEIEACESDADLEPISAMVTDDWKNAFDGIESSQ